MKCPHCLVEVNSNFKEFYIGVYEEGCYYGLYYMKCPNSECNSPIVILGKAVSRNNNGNLSRDNPSYKEQLVYPINASRPKAPIEVTEPFASDFNEACLVLPYSPKASAALSRRCLQNIIRLEEGIKEKNLMLEIDKLINSNKLPSYISENLQVIRGYGNIAAHGMEDKASGEILDVEPDEADFLLDILELLFDFYFVQAAKAASMKARVNTKLASAGKPTVK